MADDKGRLAGTESEQPKTVAQRKMAIEDRRDRVMAFAIAGLKTREIAAHIGVSHATAARDINARFEAQAQDDENATRHRQMQLRRIEHMTAQLWVLANDRNHAVGERLAAVDRITRLMDREARLLGLDKPVKLDVEGRVDLKVERDVTVRINLIASAGASRNPVKDGEVIEIPADTETDLEDYDA